MIKPVYISETKWSAWYHRHVSSHAHPFYRIICYFIRPYFNSSWQNNEQHGRPTFCTYRQYGAV